MTLIGLEEHFVTTDVLDAWSALDPPLRDISFTASTHGESGRRLADLGAGRLADMDEAGLDVAVLSLTSPGVHNLAAPDAVALARSTNDLLADTVRVHPDRLQGWATLATPAPDAAADELERTVTQLGFAGGMLFGRTGGRSLDHRSFLPIFEAAAALQVPLYLHPQSPPPAVRSAYYAGFDEPLSAALSTFGLGWHYDAGVQLLRLILAGTFERFPQLQIVTGHWGEMLVFFLERIDKLSSGTTLPRPISSYLRTNVSITPSGIFSQRYLRWAVEVMGTDRVLFSTDYPFEFAEHGGARRFLDSADLSDGDRRAIASDNWTRLLRQARR